MPDAGKSGKPVIFFTHFFGWGTRNFFQTGIIDMLLEHFEIVVIGSEQAKIGLERLGYDKKVTIILSETRHADEPRLWRLLRQARKKLYMESRHSVTEATFEKYQKRKAYQRIGGALFKGLIKVIPAFTLYKLIEKIDYGINTDRSMKWLFDQYKPKFVFFTHSTHYRDEIILRNALAFKVPTLFMVLSWDHVSTAKVLLTKNLDRFLVWNEHSRQEIFATYPHLERGKFRVVGIPQFDIYAQKPRRTYAEFCAKFGLNPGKRTILFSTMPQVRHDQQHFVIEELLKWLSAPEQAALNLQLLIKTHPLDNFDGYRQFLGKSYPVALRETSLPRGMDASDWVPDVEEIEVSRDVLYFCDININIFSTVTIEAAYFDKPVIHLAFDPFPEKVKNRVPCREYYEWDHFKHIVDKDATILVQNYDQLFAAIQKYLADPNYKSAQRRTLVTNYIGKPVGQSARAVADAVLEFARDIRAL